MTKIVLGVAEHEQMATVSQLLKALRFEQLELEGVHVLERFGSRGVPDFSSSISASAVARYIAWQEEEAKKALDDALSTAKEHGLPMRPKLLTGLVGNCLLDFADEVKADLLALGSSGKGHVEGILVGSVGRKALVNANQSVLIAKNPPRRTSGITAVLATDHSEYATRSFEQLLKLKPCGIDRVVVTTVYPDQLVAGLGAVTPHFKSDVDTWVRDELQRSNERLIESLRALGSEFTSRIEVGSVNPALAKVMDEEEADLLVMGAQGHGFVNRMLVGSISLYQAVKEKYSVLVLRDDHVAKTP